MERLFTESLKRRDKVQIFADIIKVTIKPTKTTRILRLANVQYNTFLDCIEKLCKLGLLRDINSNDPQSRNRARGQRKKHLYVATDLGLKWCEMVNETYRTLNTI